MNAIDIFDRGGVGGKIIRGQWGQTQDQSRFFHQMLTSLFTNKGYTTTAFIAELQKGNKTSSDCVCTISSVTVWTGLCTCKLTHKLKTMGYDSKSPALIWLRLCHCILLFESWCSIMAGWCLTFLCWQLHIRDAAKCGGAQISPTVCDSIWEVLLEY